MDQILPSVPEQTHVALSRLSLCMVLLLLLLRLLLLLLQQTKLSFNIDAPSSLSVTLGKFYLSLSAFSSRVGTSVPHPKPRGHSLVHPSLFSAAHLPGFLCEMTPCYEKSGGGRMLAVGTALIKQ